MVLMLENKGLCQVSLSYHLMRSQRHRTLQAAFPADGVRVNGTFLFRKQSNLTDQ